MARKVIKDKYYTFTPSTRTIVIPGTIQRERLVLITDTNTGTVLYNFSDSSLQATSYTISVDPLGNTVTTVVLNYNTSALSSTDTLSIVVDEFDETFKPAEAYQDPVNKFRTSTAQALIDTDFEYGSQSTKWESLPTINNRPFAYYNSGSPITISNITAVNGSRIITVTATTPPSLGTPVYVQETTFAAADGLYMVDFANATAFTYTARTIFTGATGTIYDATRTQCYQGYIFTNAAIGSTPTIVANGTNAGNVQITTSIPHGLRPGNEIALTGTSASSFAPNGSWTVATVANSTSFSIYPTSAPTGSITGGTLYVRPQGQLLHRAFDGGIGFSTFSYGPNEALVRQTRRYFRYQSGKGIQMSTGTVLKPPLQVDQITSSGTTVTVYVKLQHDVVPGVIIQVSGANETAYNGTFAVTQVIDNYRFQYTALSTPSATTASGQYQASVYGWYSSQNRVGMFDSQNGMFFEFDGQTLYAVKRSSTYQLSGTAAVTTNSTTVTGVSTLGVSTLFSKQLQPGDFVVIKGMSYRVENIASDTSMTIQPAYRGPTDTIGVVVSKTVDLKIPQSQWNMDRCDGTGPSGYNIDLTRMQMFYMDYSWYGAGFVRWGFRGTDGTVVYAHKLLNNNINYEAYMRSGNLPGHYETATWAKTSYMTQTMNNSNTTVYLSDTTNWPANGSAYLRDSTGNQHELVNYLNLSQDTTGTFVLTSGNNVVTTTSTAGIIANMIVQGNGIPVGTTVQSVVTNSSLTLSRQAQINGTQVLAFNPKLTGLTRAQSGGNLTVGTTANSAVITAASTSGIQFGQFVYGAGIPLGAFVVSYNTNTNVSLSQAATATAASTTATFAPYGNSTAQTFTYSSTAPTSVELVQATIAPLIAHWGTSVIMDGRYDDDKSFVFTLGTTNALTITPGQNFAVNSFRIAPAVSNGITGSSLGSRELVNRMQMILRQIDASANGNFLVTLKLNGTANIATPAWQSVGGSSLAQYINHSANTAVGGGETIYGFYLNSAGGTNYTSTQQDLSLVRDLGTSILSGGTTAANVNIYPDGPDLVTIMAQNIGTTNANIFMRLSWTEAQA